MSEPINNAYSYVPADFVMPTNPQSASLFLTDYLKKIARALQRRDLGVYSLSEIGAGLQFFPTTVGDWRNVWRKVINFGALPNTATKSVAHGITWGANNALIFTNIYATATDTTNFVALPIPYSSVASNDDISIDLDATNVVIQTETDRTAYNQCYVVLEYIKV